MYKIQRKDLADLCKLLDLVVSLKKIPKKEALSSLQCCLLVTAIDFSTLPIGNLIDVYDNNKTQFIFGLNELGVLRQLKEKFSQVWDDYDREEFITRAYCLELIFFVNEANTLLKYAAKKLYRKNLQKVQCFYKKRYR